MGSIVDDKKPLTLLNNYRQLGNSGLKVSPICLGALAFGQKQEEYAGKITYEEAGGIFNKYCDEGGNFFDTANNYRLGESEEWLGQFVKRRGNREELVIATKYSFPHPRENKMTVGNSRKSMYFSLKESLRRLDMEYIDIFYIHVWDWETPVKEILRGLDDLVKQGLVHYLGISNAPAWQVSRMNAIAEEKGWTPFSVYQGRHSIGDRSLEFDIATMCQHMGLGICPWNVLGAGKYLGKYDRKNGVPQVCRNNTITAKDFEISDAVVEVAKRVGRTPSQVLINWELQQPGITSPIVGSRTLKQLEDNIRALDFTLSPEDLAVLSKAAEIEYPVPYDYIGKNRSEHFSLNAWG